MQFFFFGSQFYELTEGFQRRFLERHQICLILNVSEIQAENAQYYVWVKTDPANHLDIYWLVLQQSTFGGDNNNKASHINQENDIVVWNNIMEINTREACIM